jgi:hypothetical protein
MKKILSLIAITSVFFSSCTKNAQTPSTNNTNSTNSTIVTGEFVITKFTDSNPSEDKTSNFNGYTFTFNTDGTITALNNGTSTNGSYSEKPSHEGEGAKLIISFNDAPLDQISKNWQVDIMSDSAIHLSDDNNAAEVLQFTAQ